MVDLRGGLVQRGAATQRLTTREARLLAFLVAHHGRDVSREELLAEVWDYAEGVVSRAVDATVNRLRGKIERDASEPDHLLTVWGHGYRFELPRTVASARAVTNLQLPLDGFFGREDQLRDACGSLSGTRLLTVVGPAGMGKTRFASEVGRSVADAYPGGVWFVAAAEAHGVGDLTRAVASALGINGSSDPAEGVERALTSAPATLMLLDNLEQAVEAAAVVVKRWLGAAPSLTVLATSRERLGIAGEQVLELQPLDGRAARALFRDRAGDIVEDGQLDRVIDRLEGLPLALELAAGLTDVLDGRALLVHLEQFLDVQGRRRDAPMRHSSLRTALDGSWATLTTDERKVLARAAVFRAGFTLEALEAVVGGPALEAVRGLRAKSLLRRAGDADGRLAMYEAVRAYALERLREAGDEPDTRERHRAWFRGRAAQVSRPAGPAPTAAGIAWIATHLDDLTDALGASLALGAIADAAQVAFTIYTLLVFRGPLHEAAALLDRVLARAAVLPVVDRGHLHRARANVARLVGDDGRSDEDVDRALACAIEAGDPLLHGRIVALQAVWAMSDATTSEAVVLFERALALHHEAGDRPYVAVSLGNLASALYRTRFCAERSRALYQEAIAIHEELGNVRSAAVMRGNLATLIAEDRELARARQLLEQVLDVHRAYADQHHEAVTLFHLGVVALHVGDIPDARALLRASLRVAEAYGGQVVGAQALRELAVARHLGGDPEGALAAIRQHRRVLGADASDELPFAELLEAVVSADLGRLGHARELLDRHPEVPDHTSAMQAAVVGLLALAGGHASLAARALADARATQQGPGAVFLRAGRLYVELFERRFAATQVQNASLQRL